MSAEMRKYQKLHEMHLITINDLLQEPKYDRSPEFIMNYNLT